MKVQAIDEKKIIDYAAGVKKRIVIGPEDGAKKFVMRIFDVSPGSGSKYHSHDWEHEVLVLSGEGKLVDENQFEIPFKAMDSIFVASNEKHCFKNTGSTVLQFLCMVTLEGEDTP